MSSAPCGRKSLKKRDPLLGRKSLSRHVEIPNSEVWRNRRKEFVGRTGTDRRPSASGATERSLSSFRAARINMVRTSHRTKPKGNLQELSWQTVGRSRRTTSRSNEEAPKAPPLNTGSCLSKSEELSIVHEKQNESEEDKLHHWCQLGKENADCGGITLNTSTHSDHRTNRTSKPSDFANCEQAPHLTRTLVDPCSAPG